MKLMVSAMETRSRYVSREFTYVMRELIARYGWRHIETAQLLNSPRTLKATLDAEFGETPEAILFWEDYPLDARAREVWELDCPKYVFADDLHSWGDDMARVKHSAFSACDAVLATYAYAFESFFPDLSGAKEVVWVPHSASPDFLIQLNERPLNAVLLSGAVNDYYPLRQRLKALHERSPERVAYLPHPGYHCGYDYESDPRVGRGYARTLHRHRACFTDSLKYGYVVAKYFEIPATGSLLLADASVGEHLTKLGFVEGVHYLPVTGEDMEEKVSYVLDGANHASLDEVRRAGQALVWERHKTADRARLINEVCGEQRARPSPPGLNY
jgi:hypothetical protein